MTLTEGPKQPSNLALRQWQRDCAKQAELQVPCESDLFVIEATTGSGKTVAGVEIAYRLFEDGAIDHVIVLTPSIATKKGWLDTLTLYGFNTLDDSSFPCDTTAWVVTYAGYSAVMKALVGSGKKRFILLGDEYHHAESDRAWGTALEDLHSLAVCTVLFSATPWRSSGTIPLLEERKNQHNKSYYSGDEGAVRVRADYVYTYDTDLKQTGDERGTVPVKFEAFNTYLLDKTTNKVTALEKEKNFDDYTPEDRHALAFRAEADSTPLGRFLEFPKGSAEPNDCVKAMLKWCVDKLQLSRDEHYKACGKPNLTMMLVVAKSATDAKKLASYIQEVYQLRTEYILSEDTTSNARLNKIIREAKTDDPNRPDVLVAVGMISEGVDIPNIKVVCFASAILTMLYIMQVLGREVRRVALGRISGDRKYADEYSGQTFAYAAIPAHPKLLYVAAEIRSQLADLAQKKTEAAEPGPERGPKTEKERDYLVSFEGLGGESLNGSEADARITQVVMHLLKEEKAGECFVNEDWVRYIMSMYMSGNQAARTHAESTIKQTCECLGVDYADLLARSEEITVKETTYPQKMRVAQKEAERLRNLLRFLPPYSDIEEDKNAYKRLNGDLNRAAGFYDEGLKSFGQAGLELRNEWIRVANELIEKGREALA